MNVIIEIGIATRRRGVGIVRRRRLVPRVFRPDCWLLEERLLLSSNDPFQPTAYEQYMLALINSARANPAAFGQKLVAEVQSNPVLAAATSGENLNQFLQVISSYGPEPPLAFNTGLIEAARDHDAAMLAQNLQFHSAADYLTNPQVAQASNGQAYYPVGSSGWATGENVFAYSGNVGGTDTTAYVDYFNAAFFLDWGNPDFGHLKNLLAPGPAEANTAAGAVAFSEIGIGLLTNVTPTVPPGANNPVATNQGLNVGPDLVTQEFGWRSGNAILTGTVYDDANHSGFYAPGEGLGSVTITAIGLGGQGTFQTQTWDSGGYSLPLPPGTYAITASGNVPSAQSTTVTMGQDNVEWDVPFSSQTPQSQAVSAPQASQQGQADVPVPGDYSGTGTTTMAVYRPSTAQWFIGGQSQPISFGWAGVDIPVPGDYDGTGHTEIAVYRPTTAQWFIAGHSQPISFGWPGVDIPMPGDYDGTGHTEIAVYRPTTGQWFIAGHAEPISFGGPGVDIPMPGDYDGVGHTEIAVYRPTTAQWFIGGHADPISFGWAGVDIPVPGDYDGVGHAEVAVYRPTTGQWFIAGHAQPIQFGAPSLDLPVRGDFDGDGKVQPAVYRPSTAQWFYLSPTKGSQGVQFGASGTASPVTNWLTGQALSPGSPITSFAVSQASNAVGSARTSSVVPSPEILNVPAAASWLSGRWPTIDWRRRKAAPSAFFSLAARRTAIVRDRPRQSWIG